MQNDAADLQSMEGPMATAVRTTSTTIGHACKLDPLANPLFLTALPNVYKRCVGVVCEF